MLIEEVRAPRQPLTCPCQLHVVVRQRDAGHLPAVIGQLCPDELIHRVPDGTGAPLVEEVAHIDGGPVGEVAAVVGVVHHVAEQEGALRAVGAPVELRVVARRIEVVERRIVGRRVVQAQSEVGVLGDEAPAAVAAAAWPPHDEVVGREVEVVEVEVHEHEVAELRQVHPLPVLLHRVALLLEEGLEAAVLLPVARLQFMPVLDHVDVLQPAVVGVYVVLLRPLADVEHALVDAVLEDDGRTPGLPVEVGVGGHGALYDGIADEEEVAVAAAVAQDDGLEVGDARALVGEELILQPLRPEALVGIDVQRLQHAAPRAGPAHAGLHQLVQTAPAAGRLEIFQVDGTAPVVPRHSVVVGQDAYLVVVPVARVGHQRDDGQLCLAPHEEVRLRRAARRQPAVAERLGPDGRGAVDGDGRRVGHAALRRLAAVRGVADDGAGGHPGGHRQP